MMHRVSLAHQLSAKTAQIAIGNGAPASVGAWYETCSCEVMSSKGPESISWRAQLVAGSHWSGVLRRGMSLRLEDLSGGANVSALFYNFEDTAERYNMP